jgi:hypothetical protein
MLISNERILPPTTIADSEGIFKGILVEEKKDMN